MNKTWRLRVTGTDSKSAGEGNIVAPHTEYNERYSKYVDGWFLFLKA